MKKVLFFAQKFIFYTNEKTIKKMLIISFISIFLSAFTLALVSAVMNGFEKEVQKTIQGSNPDIIIKTKNNTDLQKLNYFIEKEFTNKIESTSPYLFQHAIIKNPELKESFALALMTGIDPQKEEKTTSINKTIIKPKNQKFVQLFFDNKIIIGQTIAQKLDAKLNSDLEILIPESIEKNSTKFNVQNLKVGGIFKTGIDEIDSQIIFLNIKFLKNFTLDTIDQIGIKLINKKDETKVINKLHQLSFNAISWKDLHPALLSALILERYAMGLILALIILVAIINIIALLFMLITNKKIEIALLRTFGLTNKNIKKLFIIIGMGISLCATLGGLLFATITSFLINKYKLIKLPDVYYVSHLPSHMSFNIIIGIIILVIIISFLASIIPTNYIKKLKTTDILKQMS